METEKLNKKSLYQEGGNLNTPDSNALIESLSEEIQQRVKVGEPAEAILYSYLEQGVKQEQLALAFESIGYDPNAFVALMQSTEEMVNNEMQMQQQMEQMQNVENTQQAPQDIEQPPQQIMEKIPEGMIPSMAYGGDMFSNLFMFGDALNDAFGDTTNWKNQKDQYEKGKRHMWEVDFKGANVNPEDYHVTSQGELRNSKDDKKKKKVDPSLENNQPNSKFTPYSAKTVGSTSFDQWVAANKPKMLEMYSPTTEEILNRNDYLRGQAINLPGGRAIEEMENLQPNSEFTPYPAKPVTSASFNDWLSANKPRIKDLPFERNAKQNLNNEDNPFGMNYNPFAINKMYGGDINNFQEGGESYTVKSGDVLSQIAINNNIPLENILNANPGLEADKIQIGQSLVLPKEINNLQNIANKASKRINKASDKLKESRGNKIYNDLKSEYMKDLMIQENATKEGWNEEKQLWFPIKAPEGKKGNKDDIGFGYKMSPEEKKLFKNGISNEKLMSLVDKVLKEKEQVAKKYFNDKNYGVSWDELDTPAQILLTDYAYNGALNKFEKFPKAIAEKDKATMLKEYERSSDGKLLTERNKWTKKFIEDKFKYGGLHKAQNGDETKIKKTDYMDELASNVYDAVATKAKRYLNPFNWGVDDYSDSKTFNDAFGKARSKGNDEFYYNDKKFTTKYAGSEDEQLRTTGVIDGVNSNERTDFSNRIENNVYNGGFYEDYNIMGMLKDYFGPLKEATEPWGPDNAAEKDMLSLYLEKPTRYNTLGVSTHRPSKVKGDSENERYYKINDYWNNVLDVIPKDKWEGYKKNYLNTTSAPYSMGMGDYTVGQGYDEDNKQTYLSYYDKWDINPLGQGKDAPDLSMGLAKPFDLYDRQYYTDYGDGNMRKRYYDDNQIAKFDPEKKNFDTLALQKELVNRGYKLPSSKISKEKSKRPEHVEWKLNETGLTDTNRDNDYDGILGPETIAALKDLQKRNKNVIDYYSNLERKKYGGDLEKYQFAGSVPMLPRVNSIPNQSFSNIEPIDFIGGGTQFNTANANTFINPMNTSNPMGPTGIPGGASGHYYRGNTGPGSGMGAVNFENMGMEDLRNQYINSQNPAQNTNSQFPSSIDLEGGQAIEDIESGINDWQAGEDAGAWDQDPTVKRKRTVGTAMSNAENWLKNNPTSRAIGNAANIIKTGAGVLNSGLNAFNVMDAQADQKKRMSAEAVAGISQGNRGQQDLNTGLFIEDKDVYGMSKYGSEIYRNGGNIKNWFEQNDIPRAQEGIEVEIDNDMLAALIAAGADIEML